MLPIGDKSLFLQSLAHEYLAYAIFEAKDRRDLIDIRHFARKRLKTAQSTRLDAVQPKIMARWNLVSGDRIGLLIKWRERPVQALEDHRQTSPVAARAQVRFDCWIERTSERAGVDLVGRRRKAFFESMHVLEGKPKRRRKSWLVAFSGRCTGIARKDLRRLKRIACLAPRRGQ